MHERIIGIDPGLSGAVAVLESGSATVLDTPVFRVNSKGKREYDASGMKGILAAYFVGADGKSFVIIEKQTPMPRQGVTSTFKTGRGFGLWEGLIVGLGFPYEIVTPQRWKKVMLDGQPKEKASSILKAKQLFPSVADKLIKSKDGRAEALLIAEYGQRFLTGER